MRRGLAALIAVPAVGAVLVVGSGIGHGAPGHNPVTVREHSVAADEAAYHLGLDRGSGVLTVRSASGSAYTSFPLTVLAGMPALPARAHTRITETDDTITVQIFTAAGKELEEALVTAYPNWFTVTFTVAPPRDTSQPPLFFYDGRRGLDLTSVSTSFSPDTSRVEGGRTPAVVTASRTPLSPAPLDVELRTPAGWLGIGLMRVPDATTLGVQPDGAVLVDYPLRVLESVRDAGGGGLVDGMISFPTFVITTAHDSGSGLSAYHDALVAAGTAPPPQASRPLWWQEPIVDTWGQQVAERAVRGSRAFTAGWVSHFVADVKQRYGLTQFTVVIDSRWQAVIGDATPDVQRFGGISGMRHLIDALHAQGLRVMLWWPMWRAGNTTPSIHGAPTPVTVVDPTASGFEQTMNANVQRLLGSGDGDLNADGVKLDWTYRFPRTFANPQLGWGDTALYRYLNVIHTAAHQVRPDALVEASAAAPQFAAVTDAVRLYDAWSEAAWNLRATVVAVADPGILIDGDGWDVPSKDALGHAIAGTVYGVPALYFESMWGDRTPIPLTTAHLLGAIVNLAGDKGSGTARSLAGGGWSYVSGGVERARTLGGDDGLVVWGAGSRNRLIGHVLTLDGGPTTITVTRPGTVSITAPDGSRPEVKRLAGAVRTTLRAATLYTITIA